LGYQSTTRFDLSALYLDEYRHFEDTKRSIVKLAVYQTLSVGDSGLVGGVVQEIGYLDFQIVKVQTAASINLCF
jgi:hypothetical protein